jgi:hypothetical protein
VIPELSAAVINSSSPHTYPARNGDRLINTDNYLFTNRLERCEADLERLGRAYEDSFKAAFELLSRAKAMHDEMETHYVPHMSFDSISARREATLARILNLASEPIKQTGIK